MTGELIKLTIISFTDERFGAADGWFEVPVNPEQFVQQFDIQLNEEQAPGTEGTDPRYENSRAKRVNFEFVLDGTGAIPLPEMLKGMSVSDQVDMFLGVVYQMKGQIHQPKYLTLLWGDILFECRLEGLQVSYTLYSPNGEPLRAKISIELIEYREPQKRVAQEGKTSADLTHVRMVAATDTLPLMVHDIDENPALYLEVAWANGLTNFRKLTTGQELIFPPVEETPL